MRADAGNVQLMMAVGIGLLVAASRHDGGVQVPQPGRKADTHTAYPERSQRVARAMRSGAASGPELMLIRAAAVR